MIKKEHSCGGVVVNKGQVVVVFQKKSNAWSLPKGHIEAGETEEQTAQREIYEETGVKKLKYIKKLGEFVRGAGGNEEIQKTITFFHFTTEEDHLHPIDKENPVAKWVPIKEVPSVLTYEKDKAFFLSIQDQL